MSNLAGTVQRLAPQKRLSALSMIRARLTPSESPANRVLTQVARQIAGLSRSVRLSEGKVPEAVLAHRKDQLRKLLSDPHKVLKSRPKTVTLPVWGSYLKAVREGRSAVAGVKTPVMTRMFPPKTPVEVKLPPATPAPSVVADASFVEELTNYLSLLVAEASSLDPSVSSSAKGEIVEVLSTPDIAPLLEGVAAPAGIAPTVWTNFQTVLEQARAQQEPTEPAAPFEPPALPNDVAAPLLDMQPPAVPAETPVVEPETTPPPVVEPPPPPAEVGWTARLKSSVQNHPGIWAVGSIATGLVVWKGWSHFKRPKE